MSEVKTQTLIWVNTLEAKPPEWEVVLGLTDEEWVITQWTGGSVVS